VFGAAGRFLRARIPETEYAGRVERGSVVREPMQQTRSVEQRAQEEQVVGTLVCLECWTESDLARAWRAFFDAEGSLLVYCPPCAAREFDA
jgi:hypothetical protein